MNTMFALKTIVSGKYYHGFNSKITWISMLKIERPCLCFVHNKGQSCFNSDLTLEPLAHHCFNVSLTVLCHTQQGTQ